MEVKNISKHFKLKRQSIFSKDSYVKAVQNVSFQLYSGETLGLVGESGSGKSTTGQIILQLVEQTTGEVFYKGQDVSKFSAKELKNWRKYVQIVFQDPYSSLNPKKTIQWILTEPLAIHRIGTKSTRHEMVIKTLHDVGLDESYLKRYPHELSGGQRQRVAIASAIILNPEIIVIDEGVSALDVSVQAQILNLLKELQEKYQLTYLFISHDLNVIQYLSDRIAVMYLGEIVEILNVDDVDGKPMHPYTRTLFSSIPQVDDSGDKRIVLTGDIPSASNVPSGCAFHTRCPYVTDKCKTVKPDLKEVSHGHDVRCHLVGLGGLHLNEKERLHENRGVI